MINTTLEDLRKMKHERGLKATIEFINSDFLPISTRIEFQEAYIIVGGYPNVSLLSRL